MEEIKISRHAFNLFVADLEELNNKLEKIKILSSEHPREYSGELDRLSSEIIKMQRLQNRFKVVDVVDGSQILQIGYTVLLKIDGESVEKTIDGYIYNKKTVITPFSPIGSKIINQEVGHTFTFGDGFIEILNFFVKKTEPLLVPA